MKDFTLPRSVNPRGALSGVHPLDAIQAHLLHDHPEWATRRPTLADRAHFPRHARIEQLLAYGDLETGEALMRLVIVKGMARHDAIHELGRRRFDSVS